MKCNYCGQALVTCDDCKKSFQVNDKLKCDISPAGSLGHYCKDCWIKNGMTFDMVVE